MAYQTIEVVLGGRAKIVRSFDDSWNLIGEKLLAIPLSGAGDAQPPAPEASPGSAIIDRSTQEAQPTVPSAPPGTRVYEVLVKDGIRTIGGDTKLFSTGLVSPTKVEGWDSPARAIGSNDSYATTVAADAVYSTELVASGFEFDIPVNATITGIQVTVERSKI